MQKLTERQALTVRSSYYDEDSQVTYSGLTLAEWEDDPRQNPFADDHMYAYRWSTSATHRFEVNPATTFLTNVYHTYFNRDWWREASNSTQRPNDRSDPACGGMANLDTTCGNEGRVRQYWTAGVEPRVTVEHGLFGVDKVTEAGVRYHQEDQYRIQANGDLPNSREPPGVLAAVTAGSWVYGTFSTWIGDADKNRGWEMLVDAKRAVDARWPQLGDAERAQVLEQLAVCEGSDWFWWFGDYNPAQTVSDFEHLYRVHLGNLYQLLGIDPPGSLEQSFTHGRGAPAHGGVMRPGQAG